MGSATALDLRFPSDVQQIEGIVAQVVRRCRECRFEGRQLSLNVPVALTEALSNAILRGNGEDAAKLVRVRAEVSEIRLVLEVEEVTDPGDGLEVAAIGQSVGVHAADLGLGAAVVLAVEVEGGCSGLHRGEFPDVPGQCVPVIAEGGPSPAGTGQ